MYKYVQGSLFKTDANVSELTFVQDTENRSIIDLEKHTWTIHFIKGTHFSSLIGKGCVLQDRDEEIKPGTYSLRKEVSSVNGYFIYIKSDDIFVSFNQFIVTDNLIDEPIIQEENNVFSVVIKESTTIEEIEELYNKSDLLLFIRDIESTQLRTNIQIILNSENSQTVNGNNRIPYTVDDYLIGTLDYSEALRRFLEHEEPDSLFFQFNDTERQVEDHSRIFLMSHNQLSQREEWSTHRVWNDYLGWLMNIEFYVNFEFLTDDISIFQQFVQDYNNNLAINRHKEFKVFSDYDNIPEDTNNPSREGWSASLVWKEFLDVDFETVTNSKMFQNSQLYSIPFECRVECIIAKGTKVLPQILEIILNTRIKAEPNPGLLSHHRDNK